ncbi:MAG: hypothetical protein GY816_13090 [Cytophagales bacterium]|nr:hypothetical protein [Cytophagales bacterium]
MLSHSFHIPVMGIGYTLDTPIKIAKYGVSSAISLAQDDVIERARKYYCEKYGYDFEAITVKEFEFRSKRITAYLNLVNKIVNKEFEQLKNDPQELEKYFSLLPESEDLTLDEMKEKIDPLKPGSIDVNIMTKLDREVPESQDSLTEACSAFKGYAESDVESSIVLSAGMNPRLFTYMQDFKDMFPDENGNIKKQIIVKVSDYRSALIQGKILAKKGLWISEYRIESGLNCGGHAFATEGHLMGPILEEFKTNREARSEEQFAICKEVWLEKGLTVKNDSTQRITVQGGLGTSNERSFLEEHYNVDSTGWGSPFLLVPEATSIDNETLIELSKAGEDEIITSDISPLGIKFTTIKGNSGERIKEQRIADGKPGSPCFKKHLALIKDEDGKIDCTASRAYQKKKIKQLDAEELSSEEYKVKYDRITEKECICDGLAVSFLRKFNLVDNFTNPGVSVCPGPNLAYFNKTYSFKEMVDHIYGKINIIDVPRPNVFLKELNLYVQHLQEKIEKVQLPLSKKAKKGLVNFKENLERGIGYYKELTDYMNAETEAFKKNFNQELEKYLAVISELELAPVEEIRN